MPDDENGQSSLSKEEKRKLLTGASQGNDESDIEYWRAASKETRGQTLYQLLMLVNAIGKYPEKTDVFPGFPKRARPPE